MNNRATIQATLEIGKSDYSAHLMNLPYKPMDVDIEILCVVSNGLDYLWILQ